MTHFAKVENGSVTQVIVAEQDFIDTGAVGDPSQWIQTSYNTRGNVHYGQDGNPDGGQALRGNYAGIGYVYDSAHDVFYAPSPYPSWTISADTGWQWQAPVAMPEAVEGHYWNWDESLVNWVSVAFPAEPTQP